MAAYQKKRRKKDPSYKKRKQTYYPLVRKFPVKPPAGPWTTTDSLIQVDEALSKMNKRLYRQHMIYRCKVSINTGGPTQNHVNVYALAPTWFVLNAIRSAKSTYDEVMADEVEQMGKARWHDFRISLGSALTANQLNPVFEVGGATGTSSSYTREYNMSEIVCADGNNRTFALTGATSASQYNVIEEYDKMGNTSEDAATAIGGYDNAQEELDIGNVARLQSRGNSAPYDDNMNNIFVKVGEIYRDANGNQSFTTGFFDAPLGLIWLTGLDPNVHGDGIQLEIAAGKYKGVDSVAL